MDLTARSENPSGQCGGGLGIFCGAWESEGSLTPLLFSVTCGRWFVRFVGGGAVTQ